MSNIANALRLSALTCALGASSLSAQLAPASVNTSDRSTVRLADGVYVIHHPDAPNGFPQGNTLVVIGDSSVLVVDSNYLPSTAREDIAQIREWTDKPVRFLVNTHWHYDHTLGNDPYANAFPGLTIIEHSATAEEMRARNAPLLAELRVSTPPLEQQLAAGTDANGAGLTAEAREALSRRVASRLDLLTADGRSPNVTFEERLTIDLGNREVQILFLGRGNTDGDAVVFLPAERIVATGDLVAHPVPYLAGGYPSELVTTLQAVRTLGATILVPGHGTVLEGNEFINRIIEFVGAVVASVRHERQRIGTAPENADAMAAAVATAIDLPAWRTRFAGERPENIQFFDGFSWRGIIAAAMAEENAPSVRP